MNSLRTTCIAVGLFSIGFANYAQSVNNNKKQVDSIIKTLPTSPKPASEMFEKACEYANKNDRQYMRILVLMSGADPAKDATLVISAKLRKMWATYANDFMSNTNGFIGSYINTLHQYDYFAEDQPTINALIAKLPPCSKYGDYLIDDLCDCLKAQDFKYKIDLFKMSCADPVNDPPLVLIAKIQRLWNENYEELYCNDQNLPSGKTYILNYAVDRIFPLFFDGIVQNYGLNINITAPVDKTTVLDFTRDHINRYLEVPGENNTVKQMETIYQHLKNLGAKHAAEL
jgi:hypothetical protein